MKETTTNKFDNVVDSLILEFGRIPNFDLLTSDEVGNKVFNLITFRIAEITSYKELVCSHFFPATNKAIHDSRVEFQKSRYRMLLKEKELDFKETLHDTVRLAYVGLFHKLENYINDLINLPELIFGDIYETPGTAAQWGKERFDFDIRDWRQFYITSKINWICNCVKHKDGFPIKEPKPAGFQDVDTSKRLTLSTDEFKRDCEELIQIYPLYMNTLFMFAQHKISTEHKLIKEKWENSPDLYEKQLALVESVELKAAEFLTHLKQLR